MTLTPRQRVRAMRAAVRAVRMGQSVTACPYDTQGSGEQRALAGVWVRTYTRLRPPEPGVVDYSA